MKCSQCGIEVDDNQKFCVQCGNKIELNNKSQEEYNKLTKDIWINQIDKKIYILGDYFNFEQILNAKLVVNAVNRNMFSGITPNNKFVTGVSVNKELINQLSIEIKIKDINKPFIVLNFLKLGIRLGYDRNSKKYKEAYTQAQKCLSALELIIDQNRK